MRGWWLALVVGCGRLGFAIDPGEPDAALDAAPDAVAVACTVAACPSGFTRVNLGCYRLELSAASWLDAEAACETVGAHLVVEDSVDEHYDMHTFAAATTQFWIGWTDRPGPDNTFTWIVPDGGGLLQSNGCVFSPGEPDAGDADHCAAQAGTDACGDYVDIDCAAMRPYVCECDGMLADPTRF